MDRKLAKMCAPLIQQGHTIRQYPDRTAGLPLTATHPLFNAPDTVLTPFLGESTSEGLEKKIEITLGNIIAWMEGRPKNMIV